MLKEITTNSSVETIALGKRLGAIVKKTPAVILLDGNLAAGKTTLTKGIAKGMDIDDIISSPTFTIMKQYINKDNNKLYHLDLYRLNDMGMDFDLEEYVDDEDSVVVIEWPFQVEELLPTDHIYIEISGSNEKRIFKVTASNSKYEKVVEQL